MSETKQYYKVRANFYNNYARKDNSEAVIFYESNDDMPYPYYYNVITNSGMNQSNWMPCVSLEYTGNEYDDNGNTVGGIKIGEGFNCVFRTESFFEDSNGYNGCLGFAWTKNSLGDDAVPATPHGGNFSTDARLAYSGIQYGLWYDKFADDDFKGFSLTLYPETTWKESNNNTVPSIHQYTSKVSHYIITYNDANGTRGKYERYLPECIDIYYENSLSVNHEFGKYNFYLNGELIASIDDNCIDIETWGEHDGYFTAAFLASPYLQANVEIVDINYCPEGNETITTNNEEENNNE